MRARQLIIVGLAIVVSAGALLSLRRDARPLGERAVAAAQAPSFGARIVRLSEAGGYFDTDNLISNERSYLHVAPVLRARAGGGAYLGVGPDQNFAYIALLRPEVAYIVDIRRDNVLEHLLFKALFELSDTRLAWLTGLTGRVEPAEPAAWSDSTLHAIVAYIDTAAAGGGTFEAVHARVRERVRGYGYPLADADLATIHDFHRAFRDQGLSLRFTSHGRAPMAYYPMLRDLLLATDRSGRLSGAFVDADAYRFLRRMQAEDRIIPVVGDFAGTHALRAIGAELRRDGLEVRAFYTSNVEYYLFRGGTWPGFAANLADLPWHEDAVIVRSVFRAAGPRVARYWVAGFGSAQMAQRVSTVLARERQEGYASYAALLDDEPLPPD